MTAAPKKAADNNLDMHFPLAAHVHGEPRNLN